MTAVLGIADVPTVTSYQVVAQINDPPVVAELDLRTNYTQPVRFLAETVTWDSLGYIGARGRRILLSGAIGVTYGEVSYVLGDEPPEITFIAFRRRWAL